MQPNLESTYNAILATSTDTTLTVPNDVKTYKALITAVGGTLWVALNTPAAPPAGTMFASATALLIAQNNPTTYNGLNGNDVLHFFTTGTGVIVNVQFTQTDLPYF